MQTVITSARYAAHLDAHAFNIFMREEPICEESNCGCCGKEILTRSIKREVCLDAEWEGYVCLELCRACDGKVEAEIAQGYRRQFYLAEQRRLDRHYEVEGRLRALEAQNPNANWDEIYQRLRMAGYAFERCWG